MSRANHPRSRLSTRYAPELYCSANQLMDQMDHAAYNWYGDVGQDLHQRDFIFLARMQTARRLEQHVSRFLDQDKVLERLLEEGMFDHRDPDMSDAREELAMAHSSAMVQHLLMRVEKLEGRVRSIFLSPIYPDTNRMSFQLEDTKNQFQLLKSRVESQDRIANKIWRSIGGLEQLSDEMWFRAGTSGGDVLSLQAW